jgi:hypothetical protein
MNNYIQKIKDLVSPPFTNRKIVYISMTIIILFLIVVALLALLVKNSVKSSPVPTAIQAPKTIPTSAPVNPFTGGSRYTMSTYSIAYPQGSQTSTYTFTGGTTLIVEPPGYPGEPVFDVEAYNSKQNVADKAKWYAAAGGKITTLKVNNMNLYEVSNTYNMRTINSKPIHTPTQLRLAFLDESNALYVFRMYYSSSTTIEQDETLYRQFIGSFQQK